MNAQYQKQTSGQRRSLRAMVFFFTLGLSGSGAMASAQKAGKGPFSLQAGELHAQCVERSSVPGRPADASQDDRGCRELRLFYSHPDPSLTHRWVRAHCGFDGWNRRDDLREFSSNGRWGNRDLYFRVDLQPLPSEGSRFEATLPLTGKEKALHCAICIDDCSGSHKWDNNNRRDFAHAFRFPFAGPWITLGKFGGDHLIPSIQFEHHRDANACVTVWPEGSEEQAEEICSEAPQRRHRFRLRNLSPNTPYSYQITAAASDFETPELWRSPVHSFRTPPLEEPEGGWNILLLADTQDNGDDRVARYVMETLASTSSDLEPDHPAFGADSAQLMVIAGDLVYNDEPGLWWSFFDQVHALSPRIPLSPSVGNHDTPTFGSHPDVSQFREHFDLDYVATNSAHHKLALGTILFLALDSERPREFNSTDGAQRLWLETELQSRSDSLAQLPEAEQNRHWTFTHWHIPPVNAGARHAYRTSEFHSLLQVMQGQIDWHFGGHEHLYQRSRPLVYSPSQERLQIVEEYGRNEGQGMGFMVLPPAGNIPSYRLVSLGSPHAAMREMLAFPNSSRDSDWVPSEMGFVRLQIRENEATFSTFGLGRPGERRPLHLRDRVVQTKGTGLHGSP